MAAKEYKLKGFKELKKILEDMPKEVSDKFYQDTFKKSLEDIILPSIRTAMSSHYSEAAKRAVMVGTFTDDPTSAWGGISRDAFWLMWADLGTAERFVSGERFRGAYRGSISGQRNIQSAIYNKTDKLAEDIIEDMRAALIKYMNERGVKND